MVIDRDTNEVYISDKLKEYYPAFFKNFTKKLRDNNIEYNLLKDTKDIWCQDYMPVQVENDKYVQFQYNPPYLQGLEHIKTDPQKVCRQLDIKPKQSDLTIDGGSIVNSNQKVIVTDKIFEFNPKLGHEQIIETLENLFETDKITVIPHEPYDLMGHADGMVRFVDEWTVVVNKYPDTYYSQNFQKKFYGAIAQAGYDMYQLPYFPKDKKTDDGLYTAEGLYINYLRMGDKVFAPVYGNEWEDDQALMQLRKIFGKEIIPIRANSVAQKGGVLNCVTWSIFRMKPGFNIQPKTVQTSPDYYELKQFIFQNISVRLYEDEFEDINACFGQVWNQHTGEFIGDGDLRMKVYRKLEELDRAYPIPQNIVDEVVAKMLNYMEVIGQYGHDISKN